MGSGKVLRDAKQKYGIQNFQKEIICFTNSRSGAKEVEELIVDESMVKRHDCYNVAKGGHGGDTMTGASEEKIEEWKESLREGQKVRHEKMTPKEDALWRQSISEGLSNMNPEAKTLRSQNISKGVKAACENRSPEAKALQKQRRKETNDKKAPEAKALQKQRRKETNDKKAPEEKALQKQRFKETMRKRSTEAKALRIQRMSEALSGSKHPCYIHLTQEQETFIKEQRKIGISAYKIPQPFYERFGFKIGGAVVSRVLKS
jgi:hypothetical protein